MFRWNQNRSPVEYVDEKVEKPYKKGYEKQKVPSSTDPSYPCRKCTARGLSANHYEQNYPLRGDKHKKGLPATAWLRPKFSGKRMSTVQWSPDFQQ
ncbi:hypothetical protein GJ744_008598 [Endocarpon pusillum]|uniref:Uncharacterized protein n=1 Tax=Endocarpon pusillum TaxID=364733 RepID=A0A8H7AIR1_9EURO|nr:hypothetical protein GJ744_008598 [Endocarpon pusillum]